ncbi:MAG: aminotransferase class I/II-fold pyridoxal phosphate-dependent enzyme [Thermoplasmata archaeon]|nr:aminotransferase class I/II-fold pyridoxal phosphate-dependent enzyme [Thermoplasmata archaeon]
MSPSEEEKEIPPRRFRSLPAWARGPATTSLHAARRPERNAGAVTPPIYQTSTFHFPAANSELGSTAEPYIYTRYENPSQEAAAETIRALEGGEAARVFGSGMGAVATTLVGLLSSGDEVLALDTLYGGTLGLLSELLPRYGIRVRWVSRAQAAEPEKLITDGTRLVFLESPTNPLLEVHDLARWASAADACGAISVVDSSIATPINQQPLRLGIDLVVHSASKYLGGHSDLIAGAVVGPTVLMERIRDAHLLLGSVLDPFAAFLLSRGMKTLAPRVTQQSRSAAWLASELERLPGIEKVHYPGRASPQEEELAHRQMLGRSGVLAFSLHGGLPAARRFLERLELVHVAASFGGAESLVSLPAETSHAGLTQAERSSRGIGEGLVRLSVGLEEPEALLADVVQAGRSA